jgi:hypothetical protein
MVLNKQDIYSKSVNTDMKDLNKMIGEDEEEGLGQNSRQNSGAGVGVQRVATRETAAYTHAKSKEVEIKIEGEPTQIRSITECKHHDGKLPIGKQDMRKNKTRTPKLMRDRDQPIAEEYSPKLTLLQNSKV